MMTFLQSLLWSFYYYFHYHYHYHYWVLFSFLWLFANIYQIKIDKKGLEGVAWQYRSLQSRKKKGQLNNISSDRVWKGMNFVIIIIVIIIFYFHIIIISNTNQIEIVRKKK